MESTVEVHGETALLNEDGFCCSIFPVVWDPQSLQSWQKKFRKKQDDKVSQFPLGNMGTIPTSSDISAY